MPEKGLFNALTRVSTSVKPDFKLVEKDNLDRLAYSMRSYRGKKFSKSYWLARFSHWWDGNPCYKTSMPRGVCMWDGDKIVGFIGCIPCLYHLGGENSIIFIATCWYVDSPFRARAIELFFNFTELFKGHSVLLVNPVRGVIPFYERFFPPLPFQCNHQYFIFNGWGSCTIWKMAKKKPETLWYNLLRRGVGSWEARTSRFRTTSGPFAVREIPSAGRECDQLWSAVKNSMGNTRVRDARYLNWYCHGNSFHRKILIGSFVGDQMTGAAVIRKQYALGNDYLECLDLWFHDSYPASVDHILAYALRYSCKNWMRGIAIMDYPGLNNWLTAQPYTLIQEKKLIGFHISPEWVQKTFDNGENYFVLGDGDVGL
ncbi:MAG: hypothetical protein HQL77_18015 [Magnetococcales bacterium]|nr:hypothetical protein [Magnetococcales bacterium]